MKRSTILMLMGTAVASLAAVGFASACSSRRIDLVGQGPDALRRTERDGREAMESHRENVEKGLERFRRFFADYRPEVVGGAARSLYGDDAYFNDGFVELTGSEKLAGYFERSASHTAEIGIEIEELTTLDDGVYLRWIMTFETNGGTRVVAPGITHLRFDPEGRITYHRDYWDAGSALAELVPFTGAILRAVKSRL